MQLEVYNFSKLEVETNFEHKANTPVPVVNVQIQFGIGPIPGLENRYKIVLGVDHLQPANTDNEKGTLPYKIALQVIGQFAVEPAEPDAEKLEKLLRFNGGSMLYSAAREMVLIVTGRGPWGPYALPTVNFQTLKKVEPQPTSQLSASPPP